MRPRAVTSDQPSHGEATRERVCMRARRAGFTLIELLMVVVIFGGIMGALLMSFVVGRSSYLSADAYIQVQQEARRAIDEMVRELRETGWDSGPPPLFDQGYYIDGGANPLPGGAIGPGVVFQVPNDNDGDGNVMTGGTLEWGAPGFAVGAGVCNPGETDGGNLNGCCVRYRVVGTQILREVLEGPLTVDGANNPNGCGELNPLIGLTRVVANSVVAITGLNFTMDAVSGALDVTVNTITTGPEIPGGSQAATVRSRVQFRN